MNNLLFFQTFPLKTEKFGIKNILEPPKTLTIKKKPAIKYVDK